MAIILLLMKLYLLMVTKPTFLKSKCMQDLFHRQSAATAFLLPVFSSSNSFLQLCSSLSHPFFLDYLPFFCSLFLLSISTSLFYLFLSHFSHSLNSFSYISLLSPLHAITSLSFSPNLSLLNFIRFASLHSIFPSPTHAQ